MLTSWVLAATTSLLPAQGAPGVPPAIAPANPGPGSAWTALDEARSFARPGATSSGLLSGGLGVERLGEDWFASINLALSFDFDNFGFGVQLPVRLRVIDSDPKDNDDLFDIVRAEDWDSVADVLKIIRYVYVGQRDREGPYYFRVGALSDVSLGHGTIVHRYRNDVDLNRWRVGLELAGRYKSIEAHGFIGDMTEAYLFGLRGAVRPLELVFGKGPFKGLEVGLTVVADGSAPLATCLRPVDEVDGGCTNPVSIPADSQIPYAVLLDDQERPQVAIDRTLAVVGLDIGYDIVKTKYLSITPYVDVNHITAVQDGWGFHAGVLWKASLPAVIDSLVFDLRTEYRVVSQDYRGPYINASYDIERFESFRAPTGRLGTPTKLGFLCGAITGGCVGGGPARSGYFLELLAGLPQWIFVGGELLDYTGDASDGTFRLSLEVPALRALQLSASYFRVGVRDLNDLVVFRRDDRSAILARARIPLGTGFSLDAEWTRTWRGAPEGGGFEQVDNFRFGVGFGVSL